MEKNRVYHLINFFERLSLQVHLQVHHYPNKNPLLNIEERPSIRRNFKIQLHQEINQNMPENVSDENAYKDDPKDILYEKTKQDLPKDSEGDAPNESPKEEDAAIEPKSSEEKIDSVSKKLSDLEIETDTINSQKGPQQEYEEFMQDPPENSKEDAPNELPKEEDEAIVPKSSEEKIDSVSKKLSDLELTETDTINSPKGRQQEYEEFMQDPPEDSEEDAPEASKQEEPSKPQLVYKPDDTKNCFKSEIFREHLEEILRKHLRSKLLADAGKLS